MIPNGLPLTKLHHAAFDAHLIGIDPTTEFTCPIVCSKSVMGRFSTSASRGSPGNLSTGRDGLRIVLIATDWLLRFVEFKRASLDRIAGGRGLVPG